MNMGSGLQTRLKGKIKWKRSKGHILGLILCIILPSLRISPNQVHTKSSQAIVRFLLHRLITLKSMKESIQLVEERTVM